jgi:hypothetical protein
MFVLTPQALRSGASQALDSLVNLPPEGGSRPVTFSWLSALQSTQYPTRLYAQHSRGSTLRGLLWLRYLLYTL